MKTKGFVSTLLTLFVCITASAETWTDANGTEWYFTTDGSNATISSRGWDNVNSCNIPPTSGIVPTDLAIPSIVYVGETPYSVTAIGNDAFSGCSSLTSIIISEGVTSIGDGAFFECSSLISITIPEGVTCIRPETFNGCSSLRSITLPESVTSILDFSFWDCSSLISITIPEGVTSIGPAFDGCRSLKSIIVGMKNPAIQIATIAFSEHYETATLYVPKGSKAAYQAADIWKDFKNIIEYDQVDTSQDPPIIYALNSWTDANGTEWHFITNGNQASLTTQGWDEDNSCFIPTISGTIPEDLTIPSTVYVGETPYIVKAFHSGVFDGCSNLTSITIPEGVTYIGNGSFRGCSSLTSITIPDGITNIENSMFMDCSSLASITIPESVKSIEGFVFWGCSSLTSVTIPEGVTTIGNYAFNGCSKLTSVIACSQTPIDLSMNSSTFVNQEKATLYVPYGSKATYQAADVWKDFKEIMEYNYVDGSQDPPVSEFNAALAAITDGSYYLTTEVNGTKYYVTQDGYLTNDKGSAYAFAISKIDASAADDRLFDLAFLIEPGNERHFGNTLLIGIDEINNRKADLHFGRYRQDEGNNRNDWERQVFYLKNGKYAIRTSNTIYGETSWLDAGRVFWSCEPGETDGSIIPCYSYEPAYIWTLELSSIRYQVMMILQGCIDTYANQYYDDEDNPSSINLGTGFGQYSDVDTWHTFKVLLDNIAELIDNLQDPDYDYDSDPNAYTIEQANAVKAEAASLWQEILDSEVLPNDGISFADINVKAICISNWDSNRDGVLSYDEAAAVTDIGDVFRLNKAITSFDELRYFTGLENIGSFAFYDCTALTSVTFPQGLISIGTGAFSDCGNISSITIPESVTNIGGRAFEKTAWYVNQPEGLVYAGKVAYKYKGTMPGNSTIEIEGGTLGIAGEAFEHCRGLNTITIPESVTNIGSHAFYFCNSLSSIAIPSNVISIGVDAFYACVKITSITIPSSVTSIGQSAFAACHGLSSIIVEEGNPVYDSRDNCNALIETTSNTLLIGCKNSTIPNGVTSIGGDAFYQCYGLTSIYIPESVMSIVHKTFFNCYDLTSIIVDEDNPVYDSRNGCNAIIETGSNTLIVGCDNSTIPEGVTSIGDNAFIGCNFTTITIPNSVTRIGDYAFAGCSGLSSIIVPDGITYIGNGALNNTAWYYNQPDGLVYIGNFAYKYKGTMLEGTTIDIMDGTLGIVGGAFSDCSKLVSVNIPESVTSIGGHAFYGCSSLSTISIPNSVTSIGDYAFCDCNNLASVIVLVSQPLPVTENTFSNRANATLYVPAGSKAAYESAEYWKDFKEIIDMEESITFADANVKAICVANWDTNNDGELSYAEAAAVTDLGEVFNNANLEIISFNELQYFTGLTSICEDAFSWRSALTSITIPSSVTSIGDFAFEQCSALTSITIPNSVTSVCDYAFSGCSALASITIPSNVTSIGYCAFRGCNSLKSIVVEEGNPVYDSRNNCNTLIETASNTLIKGCKNSIIPEGIINIGDFAFAGCANLTSIIIPNSVKSIGLEAFSHCNGLTSITIPNSVTSIDVNAFWYCIGLTSVAILNESIGSSMFEGCCNLTSVTFSNSVTSISDAFGGCTSLTSITIPNSVTFIAGGTFSGCSNLTHVISEIEEPFAFGNGAFDKISDDCVLTVPVGTRDAYIAAGWTEEVFKGGVVEMPEEDTDISQLDNAIYIEPFTARVGEDVRMSINLKNAEAATAYVFDLVLPEGITVATNDKGKYIDELSDRHDDHTRTINFKGENTYSLSTLSGNSEELTGNDGPIRFVTLHVDDAVEEGVYPILIKNASYSKPNGALVVLAATKSSVTIEDYVLGDVNGNGGVDIGDAVSIVNYLVGKDSSNFVAKAADTNKNEQIDIGDAVTIVNLLVGKITSLTREFNIIWDEKEPE